MRELDLDRGRLSSLVKEFGAGEVTVIGDIIVDHYVWGRVGRISPEAPVPVVEVREESRRLGGAANVAHNIWSLGGTVRLAGCAGDDEPGRWMRTELSARGLETAGIIEGSARPTSIKTRVIAHSQQVVRFDRESREQLSAGELRRMTSYLDEVLAPGATVVVSDYGKGVVGPKLLSWLRDKRRQLGLRVCVDPKSKNFRVYRGFSLVTPNEREAEQAAGMDFTDEATLLRGGKRLRTLLDAEALLVTRGEHGMSLFTGRKPVHIPTAAREVFDVTGAGDTVLATLALALSVGASYIEAAILANTSAGIVVGEVGTSTVTREELQNALKRVLPRVGSSAKG